MKIFLSLVLIIISLNIGCTRQYLLVKTSFYIINKNNLKPVKNKRVHYAFLENRDTVRTGVITTDTQGYGKVDKCFFTYRPFFFRPVQKLLLQDVNGALLGVDLNEDTVYISP